jgi:hypothetical protein
VPTEELAPAPFDIDEVLSPRWLTGALQRSFPGVSVGETEVVETLESTARKVRFSVTYDDAAGRTDLPAALCVKGYFHPEYTKFGYTGIHEARFYDVLAPQVPIRVPTPRYTGIDAGLPHGLVLMDDVVAAGSVFFNQLSWYDLDTVRQSLTELATMHAQYWDHPLAAEDWLAPKIKFFPGYISDEIMNELLRGPRGVGFPDRMRDAARLKAGLEALANRYSARPRTLIHADAHLGNLYREPGGRIGFVDWQNYEFGHWSMDVAYHLATALRPADRAGHERDLLGYYLQTLADHGGPVMSMADAWEDYRAAPAYGYFLWAMTRRVVPAITEELTQRLGHSVLTHGSLEVLGV